MTQGGYGCRCPEGRRSAFCLAHQLKPATRIKDYETAFWREWLGKLKADLLPKTRMR